MPILPLPQFEADLEEEDRKVYERLKPPSSVVVRFGVMKMVGEFPYSGEVKPGCGSKMVVKTHRGTELGEMLTSTCPNSGCSKSVTRQEMLEYIENSGGRDYPFFSMQGKVLRIATAEDLNEQARIDAMKPQLTRSARALSLRMGLNMKVVDAEPIIGGEKLTFYFTSEDRIDFRELVNELAAQHHTRIEMRQVGARDEARLTADYERCGQHCCCKQFLKVLKPVSMKSAKIQKATLDPLKISGRCGRLMCCLRYEDQTYDDLRARLPRKKSRVKTPEGWGTVLDGQILTQLVLVLIDSSNEQVAVPVEDLEDPATAGPPPPPPPPPSYGPPMGGPHHASPRPLRSSAPPPATTGAPAAGVSPPAAPPGTPPPQSPQRPRTSPAQPGQPRGPRDERPRSATPPPPPQSPPPSRAPSPPSDRASEIDDFDDIETDFGDGPPHARPHPARPSPRPHPSREARGGGPGREEHRHDRRGGDGRPADRRSGDQRGGPASPELRPTGGVNEPQPSGRDEGIDEGGGIDDNGRDEGGDPVPGAGGSDSARGPDSGGSGGGGGRRRRRRRRRGGTGGGGGAGAGGPQPPG